MLQLSGKTILITGASSGIGKALAYELTKENCSLILTARRFELLEEIKSDLSGYCNNIKIIKCDVSNKNDVKHAYDEIKKIHENIDIAILNAGISHKVSFETYNSDIAKQTYNTNVFGMIYWVELLLKDFIKNKKGWIAGVSSLADNKGYAGSSFYNSSKAAVTNYLEGLRIEGKRHGVKVTTIKPGFILTPILDGTTYPKPFLITTEKAARIIVKGLKKKKRIIQFPLSLVMTTRLAGIIPGRIFEYFAAKFLYK